MRILSWFLPKYKKRGKKEEENHPSNLKEKRVGFKYNIRILLPGLTKIVKKQKLSKTVLLPS